jgi:hypothetical protein
MTIRDKLRHCLGCRFDFGGNNADGNDWWVAINTLGGSGDGGV